MLHFELMTFKHVLKHFRTQTICPAVMAATETNWCCLMAKQAYAMPQCEKCKVNVIQCPEGKLIIQIELDQESKSGMQQMDMGGYFMPTMPQPQRFFTPAQIRAQPRWPAQPRMVGALRPQQMARPGIAPRPGAPRMSGALPAVRPQMTQAGRPQPMMMANPGMAPVPMGGPQIRGHQPSFQYTETARSPPIQGMSGQPVVAASVPQQAVQIPGQEPLTATMLAAAPPQEQKQMLGERLFPLIQRMFPDLAGELTGQLLEIDNAELLHLLEDGNSLKSKVRY